MKNVLLKMAVLLTVGSSVAFANQKGLEKTVDIESYSHQERIKILQEADVCIHNAKTKEEYRACEEKEKQEREQLRQKVFEMRKQALLDKINSHPNIPQSIKDCVANATNHEQLKVCHRQLGEFEFQMRHNKQMNQINQVNQLGH
jgi:flagellar motility protein MotE (MotC chaperone)